jgi:predicted nucleic acid-binding protein
LAPGEVVLDSYAVLALLRDEDGAPVVERLLERADEAERSLPLSAVNWGEVVYMVARERGPEAATEVIAAMDALPIGVVDADKALTSRAALLKAAHRLAYADAFAAALAMTLGLPLVTGDPELRALEPGLRLVWLGDA